MKRLLFAFLLLIFGIGSAQDVAADSSVQINYEHILDFHSYIGISKDAVITGDEKIKLYASGDRIKRGIFRALPASLNINGKKVRIKYDIISIKRNG